MGVRLADASATEEPRVKAGPMSVEVLTGSSEKRE